MIVKVVCVRHGETFWNQSKTLQGQTDTELTPLGLQQAEQCGRYLRKCYPEGFDFVVSSDLKRALHTASQIVPHDTILPDVRLREMNLGIFQGKTATECRNFFTDLWHQFGEDSDFTVPEGESRRDMLKRCAAGLQEAVLKTASLDLGISRSSGKRVVLLVAHGGVMNCIYTFVNELGLGDDTPHAGNCSIGTLECTIEHDTIMSWDVKSWGLVSHLQGLKITSSKMF